MTDSVSIARPIVNQRRIRPTLISTLATFVLACTAHAQTAPEGGEGGTTAVPVSNPCEGCEISDSYTEWVAGGTTFPAPPKLTTFYHSQQDIKPGEGGNWKTGNGSHSGTGFFVTSDTTRTWEIGGELGKDGKVTGKMTFSSKYSTLLKVTNVDISFLPGICDGDSPDCEEVMGCLAMAAMDAEAVGALSGSEWFWIIDANGKRDMCARFPENKTLSLFVSDSAACGGTLELEITLDSRAWWFFDETLFRMSRECTSCTGSSQV